MIKYCETCNKSHNQKCPTGYSYWWRDEVSICPNDKSQLRNIDFPAKDLAVIMDISESKEFIEAMINLRQKDIIEYELKMSQFRAQIEQQKRIVQQQNNQPHCPYCNSINIKKISGTERVASIAALGIFSKKINKSFKCKNCGATW